MSDIEFKGKTYNLRLNEAYSDAFFCKVKELIDHLLLNAESENKLLELVISASKNKRVPLKYLIPDTSAALEVIRIISPEFNKYTLKTKNYLKTLGWKKLRDFRLGTTETQYHLYMIEVELTNRVNKSAFIQADRKIALLPHCLRDFSVNCKATKEGFDVVCKHCSKKCMINRISKILAVFSIEPYIWKGGDFSKLNKEMLRDNKSLGVLGIACYPELVQGLRTCRKHNIAVLGQPLDANRCSRWMGDFYENTINFKALKSLLLAD